MSSVANIANAIALTGTTMRGAADAFQRVAVELGRMKSWDPMQDAESDETR